MPPVVKKRARPDPPNATEYRLFTSRAIHSACYQRSKLHLWIKFRDNPQKQYLFHGFPPNKWHGFISAPSKGKYFTRYIRGRYRFS